jgi:hypothetical protein
MPRYDYICNTCENKLKSDLNRDLTDVEYLEGAMFETSHSINPTDEELKSAAECPRCLGIDCRKSLMNVKITSYIRGNGYLDVAGARRDMNKYNLLNDDPYKAYRQPGEVDDIKNKLEKAGKHDPKTKVYDVSVKDVQKVINNKV